MALPSMTLKEHITTAIIAISFVSALVLLLLFLNTKTIGDPVSVWLVFTCVVGLGLATYRARRQA